MSSKTIAKPKPKVRSEYFGATPEETGWILMRMADLLTRNDLVAMRTTQFLKSYPGASLKETQAYWDAQERSLGL